MKLNLNLNALKNDPIIVAVSCKMRNLRTLSMEKWKADVSTAVMAYLVDKPDWPAPGSFYNSSPTSDQQARLSGI